MYSISTISAFALLLVDISSACDISKRDGGSTDWSYDLPSHWADNPAYEQCRDGTNQSPIALTASSTSSSAHRPRFNYDGSWTGELLNAGHGPKFILDVPSDDYTKLPSMQFDGETVYLQSFHTHTPAEHVIDGDRSTAEMHFVHVDASGSPKAVVGFRLDPSPSTRTAQSLFFERLGGFPGHRDAPRTDVAFQPKQALKEVKYLSRYWTYSGSLTTPPCTEGLRWFVSEEVLVMGDIQLQKLLGVSDYSSRPVNHLWLHGVGA